MALSTFRSVHLYIVLLLVSVSSRILVRGQVGLCTTTGCRCTESYECCLEVSEEIQNAVAGSATIHPDFGISGLNPNDYDFAVVDSSFLTIDRDSGEITTTGAIDREELPQNTQDCILLEVSLQTPSGLIGPRTFAVNINDINDNSPEFQRQRYEFTVDESENLVCNSSLQAIDEDIGSITYQVISPANDFTIEANADEVCISSLRDLDRDSGLSSVSLIIEARDQGNNSNTGMVVLMIVDINDNAPVFINKSTILNIPENQQQNSIIMRLAAIDNDVDEANRMIQYSLIPEQDAFGIDPVTGDLQLTETLNYNIKSPEENMFVFTVQATDMGDNSKYDSCNMTIIILDVNEMAAFQRLGTSDLIIITEETIASGNIIFSFGLTDRDSPANSNNSLIFLSGGEYFNYTRENLNPLTDLFSELFYITQVMPIDREGQSVVTHEGRSIFELRVELVEGGNPEFRSIINMIIDILDINDNRPELTQTFFQLLENDVPGTQIVQVPTITNDRDEGENGTIVEYRLISVTGCSDITEESCTGKDLTENFNNLLGTFKTTGLLLAPSLDREEDGPYLRILLELTDGGNMSATHTLTLELLDKNDESPAFEPIRYNFRLSEELSQFADLVIGSVTAVDRDNGSNGTVSYALTEASTDFKINEVTGEIFSLRTFDHETTPHFTIVITAQDNGDPPNTATNMAEVVIEITDINDNVPMFDPQQPVTFTVSADADVGHTVGQVAATDDDKDENAEIFFHIEPFVFFTISNSSTGDITVARPLTNRDENFFLTVTAFNAGQEGNSLNITITVTGFKTSQTPLLLAIIISGTCGVIVLGVGIACLITVIIHKRKKLENDKHVYEDVSHYDLKQHFEMNDNEAYTFRATVNPEIHDHVHTMSFFPAFIDSTDSTQEVNQRIHGSEGSELDRSASANMRLQRDSQEQGSETPPPNSYEHLQTYEHVQCYEELRHTRLVGISIQSQGDDTSNYHHNCRESDGEYELAETYEKVQSYEQIRAASDQLPQSQRNHQATGAYEKIQRYERLQPWTQAASTHAINAARSKEE